MPNNALVQLTVNVAALLPTSNAAYSKTTITLTDAAGAKQTADVTGVETPAWSASFSNVATGAGSVTAQAFDTAGAPIGLPVSTSFTEAGSPPLATFPAPTSITVTVS